MASNRSALIAALSFALLVSGCAGSEDEGAADGPVASAFASATPSAASDSGFVDIGGGRQLNYICEGTGSPTVLFEAGDESGIEDWADVMPGVSNRTRTCAYDRSGTGSSDAAEGCRTMKDFRADLEALLRAARIEAPYVLVGASGGGFLTAGFAYAHPADVVGMVFVETPPAIDVAQAPDDLIEALKCDAVTNVERRDYVSVEHEAWDHRRTIGDIPIIVISAEYGADAAPEEKDNVAQQRGWFELSPNAKQVVVTTGHDVTTNEPDLVIARIISVLEAIRVG